MSDKMRERAGKTLYDVWDGTCYLFSAETKAEAERLLPVWCKNWVQPPLISVSVMMPDGRHRTTPPAWGWNGLCGATLWLPEPAFFLIQERVHDHVRTSQRWYLNRHTRNLDVPDLGGYRIECTQLPRHAGPCGPVEVPGLIWTWDLAAEAAENAARRDGIQHLPLVG